MQPSRRAFLFGRQTPRTPWDAFLQRLGREAQGRVQDLGGTGVHRARLTPVHRDDVRQARALCVEYGVMLRPRWPQHTPPNDDGAAASGLNADDDAPTAGSRAAGDTGGIQAGADHDAAPDGGREIDAASLHARALRDLEDNDGRPVLEIDLSRLSALTRVPQTDQWLAEPGCLVGDLAAAGLPQFRDVPAHWNLAIWLATVQGGPTGATAASGVAGVEVLLSDGTAERLSAFGPSGQQPLTTTTVQRLVPTLFKLSLSTDAVLCREAPGWPCRYRLDALLPNPPAEVNLAQLLLGHCAELAWIESVTLVQGEAGPGPLPVDMEHTHQMMGAARRLQIQMKQAFDSMDLYGG